MSDKAYYWSLNGEDWTSDEFDTIAEACAAAWEEEPDAEKIWVGERREPVFDLRCLRGDSIIESIHDDSEDFWVEVHEATHWPEAASYQISDLTDMLRAAFHAWVEKHKLQPKHFVIENAKEYTREMVAMEVLS